MTFPDAIFFDFDGVVVDSARMKAVVFRELMARRLPHLVEPAMDYYHANGGTSRLKKFAWIWENLAKTPLDQAGLAEVGDEFSRAVESRVMTVDFVPGAKEFLDAHHARSKFFLISGTPDAELKRIVAGRDLEGYFVEVHGSPRVKTEIARDLLARHGLSPERTCFVGDATTDRDAARRMGIPFVGVHGPHLTPFLDGDETMIDDLTGLERAVAEAVGEGFSTGRTVDE